MWRLRLEMALLVVSGIVTLIYLIVSAAIGIRLVRIANPPQPRSIPDAPRSRPPEFWFGCFFLLYSCIASGLNMAVYAGWSDISMRLPLLLERSGHAGFFWIGGVGIIALLIFIRQTFRPRERWARWLVIGISGALLVSAIWLGLSEGYRVSVATGTPYWINHMGRNITFIWIAIESLRYWGMLKRRVTLGLADPLTTNRFFLIGVWGVVMTILAYADPMARVLYYARTGSLVWDTQIGAPIIHLSAGAALVGVSLAASAVYLTFFPTRAYRLWVESRSAASADEPSNA
jgi:hypothetical protein